MNRKLLFLSLALAFSFNNSTVAAPYTVPVTVATTLMGALVAGRGFLAFCKEPRPSDTGYEPGDLIVNIMTGIGYIGAAGAAFLIGGIAGAAVGPKAASMLRLKLALRALGKCDIEARSLVLANKAKTSEEALKLAYQNNNSWLVDRCNKLSLSWKQEKELSDEMLKLIAKSRES